MQDSRIDLSSKRGKISQELGSVDYGEAFRAVLALLTDPAQGITRDLNELAIGHRVVHAKLRR